MKIVGLTGGIGSGKTTIAKMFSELGVPVYIADQEAKRIVDSSKVVRRKLIGLLGEDAYNGAKLNRKYVAKRIFSDKELLTKVNAIIHPKVELHFRRWIKKQDAPYAIKEAAILFENGGYKKLDLTILVVAPKTVRIDRVMRRDKSTMEEIQQRMENQWTDEKKKNLADMIIYNDSLDETKNKVEILHKKLSKAQ